MNLDLGRAKIDKALKKMVSSAVQPSMLWYEELSNGDMVPTPDAFENIARNTATNGAITDGPRIEAGVSGSSVSSTHGPRINNITALRQGAPSKGHKVQSKATSVITFSYSTVTEGQQYHTAKHGHHRARGVSPPTNRLQQPAEPVRLACNHSGSPYLDAGLQGSDSLPVRKRGSMKVIKVISPSEMDDLSQGSLTGMSYCSPELAAHMSREALSYEEMLQSAAEKVKAEPLLTGQYPGSPHYGGLAYSMHLEYLASQSQNQDGVLPSHDHVSASDEDTFFGGLHTGASTNQNISHNADSIFGNDPYTSANAEPNTYAPFNNDHPNATTTRPSLLKNHEAGAWVSPKFLNDYSILNNNPCTSEIVEPNANALFNNNRSNATIVGPSLFTSDEDGALATPKRASSPYSIFRTHSPNSTGPSTPQPDLQPSPMINGFNEGQDGAQVDHIKAKTSRPLVIPDQELATARALVARANQPAKTKSARDAAQRAMTDEVRAAASRQYGVAPRERESLQNPKSAKRAKIDHNREGRWVRGWRGLL